ncbi:Uncharacterised protein [Serratia quinivorans]|nr:Uncharacterised protein [Serratia quinivorans]
MMRIMSVSSRGNHFLIIVSEDIFMIFLKAGYSVFVCYT